MGAEPPRPRPSIVPMLSYEDAASAIDWLIRAFGFRERMRLANDDGVIGHAELELEDGIIYLAQPTPDYQGPRRHAETCEAAKKWLSVPYVIDGLHVTVHDVDEHHRRAKAAGAEILSDPHNEPYGERIYRVADLEGHRWMFAQAIEPGDSSD